MKNVFKVKNVLKILERFLSIQRVGEMFIQIFMITIQIKSPKY